LPVIPVGKSFPLFVLIQVATALLVAGAICCYGKHTAHNHGQSPCRYLGRLWLQPPARASS